MIVVSDTSPLVGLASIGHLHLLPVIFGKIIIPQKVYQELVVGEGLPGSSEIGNVDWAEVKEVSDQVLLKNISENLDSGEAEAITLAIEMDADLILIDERRGRNVAKAHRLEIVGVLGVLQIAKRRGLIDKIEPLLNQLIDEAGFRVSQKLIDFILRQDEK